ncbi:MAG: hypothetical protein MJY99_06185 [Fibrobacter sp.]|nr:hypothetical protein [Fibrobacter sp.]
MLKYILTDLGKFNKSFEQLETDDETKEAQVACRMSVEEQIGRLAMAFVDGKEEGRKEEREKLSAEIAAKDAEIRRLSSLLAQKA